MYKFVPIFKTVLWGGRRLLAYKEYDADLDRIGESWELSAVEGYESLVAEGPDAGLTLSELLAREGEALLGRANYARFGTRFPLLIKFISAREDLSIQVHPNDALARRHHQGRGKSEMWYVVEAEADTRIYCGFREPLTPAQYEASVEDNTLTDHLAEYRIQPGDSFFVPAGRVHAIGAGSLIVEIQQTSDITYRIYDYDRRDASGNRRELHTELAKEAIDFSVQPDYRTHYAFRRDEPVELVRCDCFSTALIEVTKPFCFDWRALDSFVAVVCTGGRGTLSDDHGNRCPIHQGETVLVPASVGWLEADPAQPMTLLTSWIDG